MLEMDDVGHPRRQWILAVLVLSLVLVMVGNMSLNVALPRLTRELGATAADLQWIVASYAIVFAGVLLPAGALGDRFGRKGALQLGLVTFGAGTVVASVADSPTSVIACRAVMGVGAAFVMPSTLSILTHVFPPSERAKAIGVWAAFAGAGGALGLVVSGVLLEHYWWGSIFLVNVPVIVLSLVAGAVLVPSSRDTHRTPLDPTGSALAVLGLGSLLYALIEAPERGWIAGSTLAWFAVALAILATFYAWERRANHPMLDLTLFRSAEFSTGSIVILLGFLSMFGSFFLTTQYLQAVQGYSALEAGIRTLPLTVAMVLSSPRSARFVERFGARTVVSTGLLLVASGLASMATLTASSSYGHYVVGAVLLGLGMGQTMPPATGLIMSAVPRDRAGVGSAVNDVTREVGGAIGIAVLGSLLASQYRSSLGVSVPGADEGIGSALEIAARLGADGDAVRAAARDAFMSGMRVSFLVAAAIVAVAATLVRLLLATSPAVDVPHHEAVSVS